ncbi:hypothetical protein AX17_003490 [Amanita inopinata Kibby_2008]|nr:hypothetical protein AX17_003490 [Amanita inopinata Kibby_2008]
MPSLHQPPPARSSPWRAEISDQWNVLGPFPIHAREQNYLSPAYPLNLLEPIDWTKSWPSSYADGGHVSWTRAQSDANGNLNISFPDVRWSSLRATEGWAALQYHSILRTQLTMHPPHSPMEPPKLLIQLKQASFFAIMPALDDRSYLMPTPVWYQGNIYNLEHAIPQTVELPTKPSISSPTTYDLFISGDYEVRLFGDPRANGSEVPVQSIKILIRPEDPLEEIAHDSTQDIVCDFVEGFAFGTTIGFGLRSIAGWWTVKNVVLETPSQTGTFDLDLITEIRIAPSQTRVVPLAVTQRAPIDSSELWLSVTLDHNGIAKNITLVLPVRQVARWNTAEYKPLKATYSYASSMPTLFIAIPPKFENRERQIPPVLALHGAGVDVTQQDFWANALPRQSYSWIIIPTGRTSWGLDWHGPSAEDAWSSVQALSQILDSTCQWKFWSYPRDKPIAVLGHSNGGQGAWYLASRFPDRVLGVIPAASYIKSQAYVPFTMSRSAHYIDPMLRFVLESALTPDDNDLHLSNVVDVPIFAIHGSDDENVPVWHTREAFSVLRTWSSQHNISSYQEDLGQGHWYPSVFLNDGVKSFLDRILLNTTKTASKEFSLTVSIPAESGSLHGWRIEELATPGRQGRIRVEVVDGERARVSTTNVHAFSLDQRYCHLSSFVVDETDIALSRSDFRPSFVCFERALDKTWKVTVRMASADIQPSGRLQLILSSTGPITIVVPRTSNSHELRVALRIAHDLHLFHKLDSDILDENEALRRFEATAFPAGNIVVIGNASMELVQHILSFKRTPFSVENSVFTLRGWSIDMSDQGKFPILDIE